MSLHLAFNQLKKSHRKVLSVFESFTLNFLAEQHSTNAVVIDQVR